MRTNLQAARSLLHFAKQQARNGRMSCLSLWWALLSFGERRVSRTLRLIRTSYGETETEGKLWLNENEYLFTIERPWKPGLPGGLPFESCVPDGTYELIPHRRPNGDLVFALRNPDLGVYYTDQERGKRSGRYLILIHAGNKVADVVGCIAPGMVRTIADNTRMVRSSREAMKLIMETNYDSIIIEPTKGTAE